MQPTTKASLADRASDTHHCGSTVEPDAQQSPPMPHSSVVLGELP
jgi:hypothetical protein